MSTAGPHRGRSRGGGWLALAAVLAMLPAIDLVGMQHTIVQHDVSASDLLHTHFPYRAAMGAALQNGWFPLWMPEVYGGSSLVGQMEAGALYPPHWILFGAFDPWVGLNLSILFDLIVASTGATLLARQAKTGWLPAVLAGVVFAWCGHMMSHTRHINMHAGMALLPWMVLSLEHLLQRSSMRWTAALAGLVGLQVLAGHPQVTHVSVLLLGARLLWSLGPGGQHGRWPRLGRVSGALVIGLALGAAQLVPAWAFTAEAMGKVEIDWAYAIGYPFGFPDLLSLLAPPLVGAMETWDYTGDGLAWGNYAYCGLLPLLLALGALLLGAPRRRAGFWLGMILLGLVLALGSETPIYRVFWELVPGLKLFRFPNRFLLAVSLGIAMGAALGLEALLGRLRHSSPRPGGPMPWLGLVVLVLSLADIAWNAAPRFPTDRMDAWRGPGTVAQQVHADGAPGRVYTVDEWEIWPRATEVSRGFLAGPQAYREAWQIPIGSSGVLDGLHTATGYTRLLHHRTAAFWQPYPRPSAFPDYVPPTWAQDGGLHPARRALLDRGAVTYLVTTTQLNEPGLLHLGTDDAHVYRNEQALPRAALFSTWFAATDMGAAAAWMGRDGLDQPNVPALEGGPPSPQTQAGRRPVQAQDLGPNRVELSLPAGHGGGLVVLRDSFDPGWSVEVDGNPAPLLAADGNWRGVVVPAGAKRVHMSFWPVGLGAGIAGTVGGMAALSLWWMLSLFARRSKGKP